VPQSLPSPCSPFANGVHRARSLLPGVALCAAVTLVAMLLERVEAALFGRAWLEEVVLAILVGTLVRTAWTPGARWKRGIDFSAKLLLEIAVVLLGASLSAGLLREVGLALPLGIAAVVALTIPASYGIGRLLGLPHRLAVLVAGGNSICGNSAIAAIATAIDAQGDEVAEAIAFTAVLGVPVVLLLPLAVPALGLSHTQFGVLAGLTVYAVPQVLAATAPVSAVSVQLGTLVKLVRVLTLGPVVVTLSWIGGGRNRAATLPAHQAVPWFIVGFLALATLHSFELIPAATLPPMAKAAHLLTVLSMAALGLGVDIRTVAKAGPRVASTVVLSLLVLGLISLALIVLLTIR
jgi:uncharacterized integral membrane protein (TIGR00698 family)